MIKRFIIIAVVFGILIPIAQAQVKLVNSGEREALISCQFAPASLISNGLGQTIVSIEGCRTEDEPGRPAVLYQQILVGVPLNAKIEVKMVSGDFADYSNIDLAPVPLLESNGQNDLGSYVYRKNDKYYQDNGLMPQITAKLHSVDMLRAHRVAGVRVNPTQYDPSSKKLRVYSRIQVQVTWDAPGRPGLKSDDNVYGPILADQIINYQQSKSWQAEFPKAGAKEEDPFSNAPIWYKLSVVSQGIYRLDYNYLKRNGINPDIIDPRTIKLFNGGSRAFSKNYIPPTADSLKQVSIQVTGQQDGRFDAGDQIVFFGQSLAGWDKNSDLPNGLFYNPYGDTNCYWLCWGGAQGLRMPERDGRPLSSNFVTPQSFNDTLHFEQDVFNPFNSGELWYWLSMKRMPGEAYHDYSLPFDLSYAMPGTVAVKINYRAGISSRHHLNWGLNGTLSGQKLWAGSPESGSYTDSLILSGLPAASNVLNLQLDRSSADTMDIVYLNWFEVNYRRSYQAFNYNLRFRADSLTGQKYRFRLTGFASDSLLMLDISNPGTPVNIKSDRFFQSYAEFEDFWQKNRLYWAAGSQGWQRPVKTEPYVPQNLRQNYLTVNYLVITADEFWSQAQALLGLHAGEARLQPAAAVKLSWIYNEFSFGLKDPSAIRKFLDHIYLNSGGESPKICLLFGDGSYDYREIDKTWGRHDFIPTHQEDGMYYELGEYIFSTFDDWFVRLNNSNLPQVILARIPAKNSDEAWVVVNKISRYKSGTGDEWRNRAIFMADDEFVSSGAYSIGDTIHTRQSETLSQSAIPGNYDITKLYGVMHEYPMYSGYKPDARNALIGYWNKGAGIINYFGHGAYWVWGHEWFFRDTDVSNLANGDRLPLVIMGTCGTSRYDMNRYESIGTSLVVKNGGGGIATIGATRGTYSGGNFNLVLGIYNGLFTKSYDMGQAVYQSKLASGGNPLYILMGDPALCLSRPVAVCSLNLNADTLKSRGIYSVKGKISGRSGSFNGQALLTLYDVSRTDSSLFTHSLKYTIPGQPILKFGALVQSDSLNAGFILPNIASLRSETLSGARLSIYAWGSNTDASGILGGTLWIGGIDTASLADTAKPTIELWANDLKLTDGDPVGISSLLTVKIKDDKGLNIIPFSAAQTDQVQLLINGQELKNLSSDFVFDIGSNNSGRAAWTVPASLKADTTHKFRFSVYDLISKRGLLEMDLKVISSSGENKIDGAYNYPNPFKQGTCFTFNLYQPGDVVIRIYTIGGRMIKTLSQAGRSFGYNQLYWDGRDADGSALANGVYFYKISVKGPSGEASQMGKMVVMK
jgi:hypothetical protein